MNEHVLIKAYLNFWFGIHLHVDSLVSFLTDIVLQQFESRIFMKATLTNGTKKVYLQQEKLILDQNLQYILSVYQVGPGGKAIRKLVQKKQNRKIKAIGDEQNCKPQQTNKQKHETKSSRFVIRQHHYKYYIISQRVAQNLLRYSGPPALKL